MGCICSNTPPNLEQPVLEPPKTFVALCDFEAGTESDLSFKYQDRFKILDDKSKNWWFARNSKGKEGWIPCKYVAPLASVAAEPWFFENLNGSQAEKLLRNPKNQTGSFLVRDSENHPGHYALAILHRNNVMHYRIQTLDQGGYYIAISVTFSNVQDLVNHYSNAADGLCCPLTKPCVIVEKPVIEGLTKDKWEIPRQELQKNAKLGSGNFGDVFKGLWNQKTVVAIKMLKAEATNVDQFLKEATLMKTLYHPKLVQLYGVCTVGKPVLIVTEYMVNGALLDYLRSDSGRQLSIENLIDMAAQVARGMAFLEKNNYIHRDLAARNVLVGEDNIMKIADFGLARVIPDNVYVARGGANFPVKWTALEAINYSRFSIKSDVWSFGILLTEMVTYGRIPYPGMSNYEVGLFLNRGKRMERPENCPEGLYSLLEQCWDENPEKRPTFVTLQDILDGFFCNAVQYQEGD